MCILTDLRFPEVIGFQKEAVHHTFVVPDPAASDGKPTQVPARSERGSSRF